jgi:L-threonylcarbamoyladenylate synthase
MKSNQSNIKKAKKYLNKNYGIGVPTETVYGLAANAYSDSAVKKIFDLKKRPKSNSLIVHYLDIDSLKRDCLINDNFIKLYKKFSPGPITYILKLKQNSKISQYVTNNKKSLAVRFPKHTLLVSLLKQLDYPLAAPSANITTKLSAVQAIDVREEFGNKIKYILDGGKSSIGLESTIISLVGKPTILRLGGLDISKIQKTLGFKIDLNINPKNKISPGQSHLHYSPGIPLRTNIKKPKKNEAFILIKEKNINFSH